MGKNKKKGKFKNLDDNEDDNNDMGIINQIAEKLGKEVWSVTQEDIEKYCITPEQEEEKQKEKEKEEEQKQKEEEQKRKEMEGDTFVESFEKHKLLWIGLFSFAFTTILGIIGIIILIVKIHKIKHPKRQNSLNVKESELSSKFITNSEVQQQ